MPSKQSDYERWLPAARAVGVIDNPLRVPYDIGLKEAAVAAAFMVKRWEATPLSPGLERVKSRLPQSTGTELNSIVHAVQDAQTRLLLIVDPVVAESGERARFLVDELESAIAFLLDDGVDESADEQLAKVREFHAQDGQRSSALAQSLRDYAALARTLEARLVEVDDEFDPKLIAEAEKLATALAESPIPAAAVSPEAKDATLVRNQMLSLMVDRVGLIRRTAAHVFRAHPAILREVTSAYDRRRRAAARKARVPKGQPAPNVP